MKLIKEEKLTNLDRYISINLLKQFAHSKNVAFNYNRRSKVLWMQELYVDFINKRNLN